MGFQEDRDLGYMGQFGFGASLDEEGAGAWGLRGKAGDSQVGEKQHTHRVVSGFLRGHRKQRTQRGSSRQAFAGVPCLPLIPTELRCMW